MSIKDEIIVVATFVAKDGESEKLQVALSTLIEPTRKEEGCLRYELHQGIENPKEFTVLERFKNMEAAQFHTSQTYLRKFIETTLKELVESSSVKLYKEVM